MLLTDFRKRSLIKAISRWKALTHEEIKGDGERQVYIGISEVAELRARIDTLQTTNHELA
jgi:hypothetical protein